LLDHREEASNIFSNDPTGPDFIDATVHVRPEVTVILRASSLPGITERLAWESSRENIDLASPFPKICFCDVVITLTMWIPVIKNGATERVNLAMEEILPSEHCSRNLRATYTAEY
jgi:hypothetical protein